MGIKANANARKLIRKAKKIEENLDAVRDNVMEEAAFDLVDAVDIELRSLPTDLQVGFDRALFIEALRLTLRRMPDGTWNVDPYVAGGDMEDFEEISGVKGLWHMGKNRSEKFRQFVYERAADRSEVAAGRQAIWGDKTPQWILINEGTTEGMNPQPPTHFMERAMDQGQKATIRRTIKSTLKRGVIE